MVCKYTKDRFGNNTQRVIQSDVDVQHPLPSDGDSIYEKDIDINKSSSINFSGNIVDLFNSLDSVVTNTTSENPKTIKVSLNRTIYSSSIGLGCSDLLSNFSNIVIKLLGSGDVVRDTVDNSLDNTKYNSKLIEFSPSAFNGFIIEFHTEDPVCLSNVTSRKSIQTDSRIQGLNPLGKVVNFQATQAGNFKVSVEEYGDTPSIDAFARLRVSNPFTLFDSKQLHDKQPLFWDEVIGGNATSTHVANDANVEMEVIGAGDYVVRQTRQRFNYQPGKSQLVFITLNSPQSANVIKRTGIFDSIVGQPLSPNNGIFFETDGDISWNICKAGVIEETVLKDSWNLDKLDGLGPSGVTLDLNGSQILVIDYEWLGVGRVRVGFVVDGIIRYCHYFNHANSPTYNSVYMSTPNLPIRFSIESNGGSGILKHICSSVMSEGGVEETGILRVAESQNELGAVAAGTSYAIIGIKLKDLYRDITVIPESISALCTTKDSFRWAIVLNPAVAGTFNFSDLSESAIQVAYGDNTNVVSGGEVTITSGYSSSEIRAADKDLKTALRIGSTINGSSDVLALVITPYGTNSTFLASMSFRELL